MELKLKNGLILGLVVKSSTDQEVPGLILVSAVGFFASGDLFHGVYGLAVSVFQDPLPILCLWRRPLDSNCVHVPIMKILKVNLYILNNAVFINNVYEMRGNNASKINYL